MVGIFAHDGGAFKPAASVPVKNGSVWQNAQEVWANNNGVWTKVFPSVVREPATGEYYDGNTNWQFNTANSWHRLAWFGTIVHAAVIKPEVASITIGSWTYYRGSFVKNDGTWREYKIYRIGTP